MGLRWGHALATGRTGGRRQAGAMERDDPHGDGRVADPQRGAMRGNDPHMVRAEWLTHKGVQ